MRRSWFAAIAALAAGGSAPAQGGSYYCDSTPVAGTRCPDGSLAIYRVRELTPNSPASPSPAPGPRPDRTPDASAGPLFGKWHTNVAPSVISREIRGMRWTEIFPGAVAGDLLIKPDGTYAWASYGGKVGRWVATGGSWPIELIDTTERRRWKVGLDERGGGRRIFIWDGDAIHYVGTR